MQIYTKTGDKGTTSLYDGTRVDKDDIRVEAYGTIDELNSVLGLAKNYIKEEFIVEDIEWIQTQLFNVAGELAMQDGSQFPNRITDEDIKKLESMIDDSLGRMKNDPGFKFILPGSNLESGALHVARTVCRRAERRMLTLSKTATISKTVVKFINRLSDTIYAFGRYLESEITLIQFDDKK